MQNRANNQVGTAGFRARLATSLDTIKPRVARWSLDVDPLVF